MGSLREITYRLWRRLEGANIPDDTKYTYRELKGYVTSGYKQALKNSYLEQRNVEDFKYGDDSISFSYTAPLLNDEAKELSYIELRGKPISFAGNRFVDINSANPASIFAQDYFPVRKEEVFLIRKQNDIPCMTYFYKEDKKAYFFGKEVKEQEVHVTERYSLSDDDDSDTGLPEEIENQAFELAYRLLVPVAPADRANDGVSNN